MFEGVSAAGVVEADAAQGGPGQREDTADVDAPLVSAVQQHVDTGHRLANNKQTSKQTPQSVIHSFLSLQISPIRSKRSAIPSLRKATTSKQ